MRYLIGKLQGASSVTTPVGGRIYGTEPPQSATYPYILVQQLSGVRLQGPVGLKRTGSVCRHLVEVYGNTTRFADIEPIVDAIEAVLDRTNGPASGGNVLSCRFDKPFEMADGTPEFPIRRLGAEYVTQVQIT
jgi:hypothetical protein